jgi:hypothetical protein
MSDVCSHAIHDTDSFSKGSLASGPLQKFHEHNFELFAPGLGRSGKFAVSACTHKMYRIGDGSIRRWPKRNPRRPYFALASL